MIRKRLLPVISISLVFVFGFPVAAFADSTDPTVLPDTVDTSSAPVPDTAATVSSTEPVASSTDTGPASPTGADSYTYTQNPVTGLWENAYYIWDPATNQTRPKTTPSYSYNPTTGRWDTTNWVFDAPSGTYVPNVVSINSPPLNNNITQDNPNLTSIDSPGVDNTPPISDQQNNGVFDLFYDATISNSINSMAASGDAGVLNNTIAGNALSGNALDVSSILNMLQSTWNMQPAANLLTFTSNIDGNVVGDIIIDPGPIQDSGPLSVNDSLAGSETNLTINNQGSGLINNDITVGSSSGKAAVSNNTNAGDAISGAADAVANVVNVLNSAISAGQSFLGVININGNLNGDILLPPNFIDQLIASGAPSASIDTSTLQNTNLVADLNDTQTISNNVNLAAASGSTRVDGNTTAGSATSGNAATHLTIFNLTGRQIVGTNSLLVFVNVLGQWVGLIMDAPPGSNTAALCGGSCQTSDIATANLAINSDTNNTINNNLYVTSQSGDAAVTNNTHAGSATSGDATASANLMNISSSDLSFSNWFGILFINVLGSWNGSFGVNTTAGDSPANPGAGNTSTGVALANAPAVTRVFRFVPGGGSGSGIAALNTDSSSGPDTPDGAIVLASAAGHSGPGSAVKLAKSLGGGRAWLLPLSAGAFVAILIIGAESISELNDKVSLALLSRKMRR